MKTLLALVIACLVWIPAVGSHNADSEKAGVYFLQSALTLLDHSVEIDGKYGEETTKALRSFQRSVSVPESGVLDWATYRMLFIELKKRGPPTLPRKPSKGELEK